MRLKMAGAEGERRIIGRGAIAPFFCVVCSSSDDCTNSVEDTAMRWPLAVRDNRRVARNRWIGRTKAGGLRMCGCLQLLSRRW